MPDIDADTLADKILSKIRGTRTRHEDDDDDLDAGATDRNTLRGRVSKLAAERRELLKTIEELGGQVDGLKSEFQKRAEKLEADHKAQVKRLHEETAAQVTAIAHNHAEDLELVDLGFKDPLGRNAVRDAWGRLPEPQRGASPIDWLRQQVAAAEARAAYLADPKADPAKAPAPPALPRTVAAYLPEPAKVETTKTETTTRRAPAARVDESARNEAPDIRNFDPSLGVNAFLATLREGTPDGG